MHIAITKCKQKENNIEKHSKKDIVVGTEIDKIRHKAILKYQNENQGRQNATDKNGVRLNIAQRKQSSAVQCKNICKTIIYLQYTIAFYAVIMYNVNG